MDNPQLEELVELVSGGLLNELQEFIQGGEFQPGDLVPLLFIATEVGYAEIIRFLVEFGVDINARSEETDTVLFPACSSGLIDVVRTLLELGVDVASMNENSGENALFTACMWSDTNIIELLLQHGADLNFIALDGETTPFLSACKRNRVDVALWLLENGAIFDVDNAEVANNVLQRYGVTNAADRIRLIETRQRLLALQ